MIKMDDVLAKLGKQAAGFGETIDKARQRTRVVRGKLRSIEVLETDATLSTLSAIEDIEAEA